MQTIVIMLTLLLLPYWLGMPVQVSEPLRARIGIALMFAFTGAAHFFKTSEMVQMLPAWVPMRFLLIYLTGIFELLAVVTILITPLARPTGVALCIFLPLILPSNIYAALQRVEFGGGTAGPVYLLVRIPLQFFLIGWIYWFAVRPD